MTPVVDAVPAKATRREWIGLGVLALGALLYVMDLTVLHLAIPAISADLQPTSTQLLWIIDIYGFMVAGWLITMGPSATGSAGAGCCSSGRPPSAPSRSSPPSARAPRC